MVICLERAADLHMAQLMPLSLTVSCFSKIQIDFTILVPAHPGSHGKWAVKRVCVCILVKNIARQPAVQLILTFSLILWHCWLARRWSSGHHRELLMICEVMCIENLIFSCKGIVAVVSAIRIDDYFISTASAVYLDISKLAFCDKCECVKVQAVTW